jgi:hypothetical protein
MPGHSPPFYRESLKTSSKALAASAPSYLPMVLAAWAPSYWPTASVASAPLC